MIRKTGILALLFSIILIVFTSVFGFQMPSREYVIYNSFGYVIESRTLSFNSGTNSYTLNDLPSQIQRESIFIDVMSSGVSILQQKFDANVFNFNGILNRHRGKSIQVSLLDGEIITGIFFGMSGSDLLIRDNAAFTAINRSQIKRYTIAGITNIAEFVPVLHILASSPQTSEKTIRIHYLVNNIGWSGEYVGAYNADEGTLLVKSWARIKNNSGSSIETRRIILIAGEPHTTRDAGPIVPQVRLAAKAQTVEQAAEFIVEEAHIFHKFTLEQVLNLENNNEQQVSLFPEKEIIVNQKFIFDVSRFGEKVINILDFTNDRPNGFGEPLPSGKIRLYQVEDNSSVFLGEDRIQNTPIDGNVTLQIGAAFDLIGKRTQKQYRRIGDRSREETYEIELHNSGTEPKDIVVNEHFFGEWRILDSSTGYTIPDSRTAEFIVTVPAGDKIVFTYTVRYN